MRLATFWYHYQGFQQRKREGLEKKYTNSDFFATFHYLNQGERLLVNTLYRYACVSICKLCLAEKETKSFCFKTFAKLPLEF